MGLPFRGSFRRVPGICLSNGWCRRAGPRTGASVINCCWVSCNRFMWYGLSPNAKCVPRTQSSLGIIIRFGSYRTRWGKRKRFRCKGCGRTFCRNSGAVYHRLQHRRATFDKVAAMSVEGVNKSSIARAKQVAWNTVDRWLEKAAAACRRFNHQTILATRSPSFKMFLLE